MVKNNITIQDARIIFRNFTGKESRYNAKGSRNFCVILDEDLATQLSEDGWNVKWPKESEDSDETKELKPYIQVKVKYGEIPPKVVLITSRGQQKLDEEDISMLDWAAIDTVDLVIRPYNYEVRGTSGVSAYLRSMYVTIAEDELDIKYSNIPEISKQYDEE